MSIHEKKLRLAAHDKTTVLILTTALPYDIPERTERFYRDGAEAFEKSVRERLFYEAQNAYEASTDRRKRYRYTPWQAEFICTEKENDAIELTISANGTVLRHEMHHWNGNELLKRVKIRP
ncbi:MAG: hypothetical protein IJY93_00430 [Clostridia bacterium]|nr:hypothetical protein [Clostridia bacterium]